jgi:hypothetical protein
MATLTTQNITRAGLNESFTAAAGGGDAMEVGSGMFLYIKNGGGSPITVTLTVPSGRTYEPNVAITSPAISVTNAQNRMVGPIDAGTFADPTTGLCTITYSGVTSVTVGAFKLTQP